MVNILHFPSIEVEMYSTYESPLFLIYYCNLSICHKFSQTQFETRHFHRIKLRSYNCFYFYP